MKNIEKYLTNYFKGANNPSLDAMKYFMEEYNNFEKEMKFIHIAGTNGKGSVVQMISSILVQQGYKVGKFISPHLVHYNERISINEQNISDEDLEKIFTELEPKISKYNASNKIPVTFFELTTIIALLYFCRNDVDFVVLETGLGGLFDCTNIISSPLVSIITSIGFDHVQILGNTLPEIAYQKAGIIKEDSNTIFFEQSKEVNDVFINVCKEKNNKLHLLKNRQITNYHYDVDYQYFDFENYKDIAVILKGKKQIQNATICIECMRILNSLGYQVDEESIRTGLKTVVHKGRLEILNNNPLIQFDGAHNVPAIQNLQSMIDMYYKDSAKVYIVSILKRKDYTKMVELLMQDKNATFIFTSGIDDTRYISGTELLQIAQNFKSTQKLIIKNLDEAIKYVMENCKNCVTFFVGSFYTYSFVTEFIKYYKYGNN